MRILDEDGNEVLNPDYQLGHTAQETIVIAHHDAVEPVEEVWHYEVIAEYPNGGKDLAKVIDVPGVEGHEAWDETEDILRYIPFTTEELQQYEQWIHDHIEEEKALRQSLIELLSAVDILLGVNENE